MAGRQTVPAVLETQKATHGHLAAVYEKIQSAASKCVPRPRAWRRSVPVLATLPRRARGRARSLPLTVRVLRCSKLWHQATLAVEELAKDPCFSAEGNKDLLTLYDELVKDQPPSAQWSGFGSRMNAVKHAGACSAQVPGAAADGYRGGTRSRVACLVFVRGSELPARVSPSPSRVVLPALLLPFPRLQRWPSACRSSTATRRRASRRRSPS
jgi:hypothetical protein